MGVSVKTGKGKNLGELEGPCLSCCPEGRGGAVEGTGASTFIGSSAIHAAHKRSAHRSKTRVLEVDEGVRAIMGKNLMVVVEGQEGDLQ